MIWIIGVLGFILLVGGFSLAFINYLHFTIIFALGLWLFMAFLNKTFFQKSNLSDFKRFRFYILLLLMSFASTLLIELVGAFLSQTWVYSFDFFDFKILLELLRSVSFFNDCKPRDI